MVLPSKLSKDKKILWCGLRMPKHRRYMQMCVPFLLLCCLFDQPDASVEVSRESDLDNFSHLVTLEERLVINPRQATAIPFWGIFGD